MKVDKPKEVATTEEVKDGAEPTDKDAAEQKPTEEATTQNDFVDDKRLFVMNLSYTVTKEELQDLFGKYG